MNIISKEAYEGIQKDIYDYMTKYDFPNDYKNEFVMKIKIATCYFSKEYKDLKIFTISEPCLYSLLDIVTEKNKGYVLSLIDSLSKKINFEVEHKL